MSTEHPTLVERRAAYDAGAAAASVFDNPFHRNYPNPSKLGAKDEILAQHWIDGYCKQPFSSIE